MRKIMGLIFVLLMSFGVMTACSSGADAIADYCKKQGGTTEQCKCTKDRVNNEMSDDESSKAVDQINADKQTDPEAAQMITIYNECTATSDGTGDGGTDTGS
jgi:hypothetical protein